jgi:hypothetical protein
VHERWVRKRDTMTRNARPGPILGLSSISERHHMDAQRLRPLWNVARRNVTTLDDGQMTSSLYTWERQNGEDTQEFLFRLPNSAVS